jgi:hypothetical protein
MFAARNMMFAGIDADMAAFIAASGATDTAGIAALVAYLKAENLWTSTRFFPFKSAQNAGSGSTVYGLGGLSAANLTATGSPTWGAGGIALTGTQWLQGALTAVDAANESLILLRQKPTLASAANTVRSIVSALGYSRSTAPTGTGGVVFGSTTALTAGELQAAILTYSVDTTDANRRLGTTQGAWSANEDHVSAYQLGNDYAQWKNKTSLAIDKTNVVTTASDCGPSDIGDTGGLITIGGRPSNGTTSATGGAGVITAYLILATSAQPTTLQRETITDLINAL